METSNVANLIKSARAAALAGDRQEAVRLLHEALELQPDDADALLALAGLSEDVGEKRRMLERVLAADPANEEAKAALALLAERGDHQHEQVAAEQALFCANHPQRETYLRCNKCNKPICTECAVLTPVGYRCRECVRAQQDKFYTATTSNQAMGYAGAAVAGVVMGLVAVLVGSFLPGFFGLIAAFFLGSAVGGGLSEIPWRAAGRKRARHFNIIATGIAVIVAALIALVGGFVLGGGLGTILFVIMAASAMFARLRYAS
ncbi:MAG: hypothetical protein D6775_12695 [Caldilineae bacterium]|nr:MAG: hypothetical protein D6775_12695 [Caldilineae bacterium]